MKGININCSDIDFIDLILNGKKIVETRDCNSLHPYIGQKVGLIKTGKGKATLMGYATIITEYHYHNLDEFRDDEVFHCVLPGSKYDYKNDKYGYLLACVESCTPIEIHTKGIIARRI